MCDASNQAGALEDRPRRRIIGRMDIEFARSVLKTEADAVGSLAEGLGDEFLRACRMVLECSGRVVVTGVGKAGLVGTKIAATLTSTGTPSLFLRPTDALHGDLGMVMKDDLLLALSNSGETEEILRLIPYVRQIGAKVASMTSSRTSGLGKFSDVVLEMGRIEEACPLGLAPSASTTAMMALGDALALTVQKERGFTGEDYARFHPAGELGRKLLRVEVLMRTGERCPVASPETPVRECVGRLTRAHAGCLSVVDGERRLLGVFTDGDFRRACEKDDGALRKPVREFMTENPKTIRAGRLVGEAMAVMRDKKINALAIVDDKKVVVGLLDVQDIVGLRLEA